jgi:chromosome partitioning protein
MTKSIAFVHHKGGTGKTTSCINISGFLLKEGKKVLLVDIDPQGNATSGLGIDKKTLESSMCDVLVNQIDMREIILETEAGVHLAPSTLDLIGAEEHLHKAQNWTVMLKEALENVTHYYDYITIDTPPGSSHLMVNGLVASDGIIITLDPSIFSLESLESLTTLLNDIHDEVGQEINIMRVILCNCKKNIFTFPKTFPKIFPTTDPIKEIKAEVKKKFGDKVSDVLVPYSTKIYEAQLRGLPISHYAPKCKAARAYEKIAKEVMSYG